MTLRRENTSLSARGLTRIAPPMLDAYSPPQGGSRKKRSSSIDSIDESFFLRPYVPLSNLPTPPLCFKSSSRNSSPEPLFPDLLDQDLFGPAVHLNNLIPVDTSLNRAAVPLIQAILTRAALPIETMALAVCILDTLPASFSNNFRRDFPLGDQTTHIDELQPELLVLGALILAVKFIDDTEESIAMYKSLWGGDMWSCRQINYTQKCLLEGIGWRIMPLWVEANIKDAVRCMKLASLLHEPEIWDGETGSGKAVQGLGEQLTPAETPLMQQMGAGWQKEQVSGYFDAGLGLEALCLGC